MCCKEWFAGTGTVLQRMVRMNIMVRLVHHGTYQSGQHMFLALHTQCAAGSSMMSTAHMQRMDSQGCGTPFSMMIICVWGLSQVAKACQLLELEPGF
jgi:hypothetical protein